MRRIVFSIALFRKRSPVRMIFRSTKSRQNFYAQLERQGFHTAWVKRRNTRSEQMFSAVPPTADIRRERRLRHAESPTLHLGDASMGTVDEIGRVDPSVNDSSTPSARLQIALQKRPLIDCQSGYDFAGGNLNSKAATT